MCFRVADVHRRALTVSRKSERLVNLTIALLATKRYLTKSEIFRTVDGYEGAADSKDRMFERDKDDLRNLGIEIEVGSFDPLFEDEPGYRINPHTYEIQLKNLTPGEYSLLLLAAERWSGSALTSESMGALIKLRSLGIASDVDSLPGLEPQLSTNEELALSTIVAAIAELQTLDFSYIDKYAETQRRNIEPYGIRSSHGYWYLVGRDISKSAIRTFRIDRIEGVLQPSKKTNLYEIPQDFKISEVDFEMPIIGEAKVRVRVGKVHALRKISTLIEPGESWDILTIPFTDKRMLIHRVLWHLTDAVLLEPQDLVAELKATVANVQVLHG